jgi:hypothetical protein
MKESSGNGAPLSVGAVCGETREGASLLGKPSNVIYKALEMGVCFHGGGGPACGGTWRDAPFLGPSKEGRNICL